MVHSKRANDLIEGKSRAFHESLKFKEQRVAVLSTDPSSGWFMLWFTVSCHFPVITACLGPVANMISVACAVDHWREDTNIGQTIADPYPVRVLNIFSLVLGFIANLLLLLHFSGRLAYLRAQYLCIPIWTLASIFLLAAILLCSYRYFEENYVRTIGYWYAVITVVLYVGCTFTLSIHLCGYFKKKYPAMFNLMDDERRVMTYTFCLAVWFFWGAGVFSKIMDLTYGTALYFLVVSVLTIGLGDIVPDSTASRILILIYAAGGVIIVGLIIAMTRSIMHTSSSPIYLFYAVEKKRRKVLERETIAPHSLITDELAFNAIEEIRTFAKRRQKIMAVATVLTVYICFVVLGSTVLYFAESWSYFIAVYFCFLSLFTIGYGDYAPETGCGRAFYVVWCIGAVPLMTGIIATIGDSIYEFSDTIDLNLSSKLYLDKVLFIFTPTFKSVVEQFFGSDPRSGVSTVVEEVERDIARRNVNIIYNPSSMEIMEDQHMQDTSNASSTSVSTDVEKPEESLRYQKIRKLKRMVINMKELDSLSKLRKDYELSYHEWMRYLDRKSLISKQQTDDLFWLSEESPLRYPLEEPTYVLHRTFAAMEKTIDSLLEDYKNDKR